MDLNSLISSMNYILTLGVVFPAIVGLGVYLSCKLRLVQIFQLREGFASLTRGNKQSEGSISRFEALSAVLAGNFGTGNISGMAVAIATGGPGALVWMWVMAFLGSAIQYSSCILGVLYRRQKSNGDYVGGPMYYLRDGLGYKRLAALFCCFTLFGAITVGNFAQINSVVLPLEAMGLNAFYCSIIMAVLVAGVILGGIQRLGRFASYIVPVKALLYLSIGCVIIGRHYEEVLPAIQLMFKEAFNFSSLMGGVMGFGVLKAIATGFDRGLFATDAGTGIVPILQASARSENPVSDGIASLVAPLMVMVVCTMTGLVLIVTGAWQESGLQSTNMVIYAFTKGLDSPVGGYIVIGALLLFAYTTILAWAYCGEKALGFLFGRSNERWFRLVYLLLVPVGSLLQVNLIWTLADTAIALMLILNLVGVAGLSPQVIALTASRLRVKPQLEPREA